MVVFDVLGCATGPAIAETVPAKRPSSSAGNRSDSQISRNGWIKSVGEMPNGDTESALALTAARMIGMNPVLATRKRMLLFGTLSHCLIRLRCSRPDRHVVPPANRMATDDGDDGTRELQHEAARAHVTLMVFHALRDAGDAKHLEEALDIECIKEQLEFITPRFPRGAVRAAIEQQEAIKPWLLEQLAACAHDPEAMAKEPTRMSYIYAMYLLAQFREPAAYPLLIKLFSTPGEISLEITGDVVTEDLSRILASVCAGDIEPIKQLIETPSVNEYVRSAALRALMVLVCEGLLARDEAIAYLTTLFRGKIEREYEFFWTSLVLVTYLLYPEELIDDIEQAYDDELIDSWFIRLEDVKEALARGKDATLEETRQREGRLIDDILAEMENWACFELDYAERRARLFPNSSKPLPGTEAARQAKQTPPAKVAKVAKVGRNDPCPCGSGKKYKKCCLS